MNRGFGHPTKLRGMRPLGLVIDCWADRRMSARIYPNGKVEYFE
ncbi:MAG TPA: hypothetical protein VJI13_00035 [Candidatus Norongarragalinales archaeon]|nr:hypothetical protein [Candidatus Norongarragalinales archaeon]